MSAEKYWGTSCKHGHVNEDGKSLRYVINNNCIECGRMYTTTFRNNGDRYKEYQKEYQRKLSLEHPEKRLIAYNKVQAKHGKPPCRFRTVESVIMSMEYDKNETDKH